MRFSTFIIVAVALHASSASVQMPPRISKQPPTDEVLFQVAQKNVGDSDKPFLIECEAEGEPAPEYRWIKNGKEFVFVAYDNRITQQPGRGTLVIMRAGDEDLGQYQCFAHNEFGTATSNSVFVRKAELNYFKDEDPKTVETNEGEPFQLACTPPDGWPKPRVHWMLQQMDGSLKSINNSRMTLDPEGNLWFSNVTRDDASANFFYACVASSHHRKEYKIGNRFILKVSSSGSSTNENKYPPSKQYLSRKNEVALRGKRMELYCIYGGTPLPETVWMKNGVRLRPTDRVMQGDYGKSLVIKTVDFDDEGTYTCEASNGVGTAQSHSMNLKVQAIPYFIVEPEITTTSEDETVEFKCEANGVPEPEIKWIHNGKPIAEAPPNPRRTVTANSIIIEKLKKTDTGNYGCNATNALGYVYKDVYVNVLALPPDITEPPRDLSTVDGKTAVMTCRVSGAPRPTIKWIRGGQELTGGRYKIRNSGDLVIESVTHFDGGNYTCHAKNKLGEDEANAILIVKEHTRITYTPEDYEVSAGTTATFRCNAIADPTLRMEIEWLSKGDPIDPKNDPRYVLATDDHSLSITKTTELDSGIYTCVAKTDLDEVRAQATLTVQDVPNPPDLLGTKCHEHEAEIRWSASGDNRAPILRYSVQHNTSFTPDAWEDSVADIPSTVQTYMIPMSPWANYTFRVRAWNKIGPSLPSPHGSVCTTQPDVPHKNPGNVMGNGTDHQNIVISWTIMPQIEHNGPKFMYRVFYKRDIPGESWTQVDITDWKRNRLQIDNQPTYERYKIKVMAINEKGESLLAPNEVVGYSGEDQPTQAPGNFTLVEVKSSTTAELWWDPVPVESIRGQLRGYRIQTWTEKDGEEGMREINVGNKTRVDVDKFVPFTTNYARVVVFNGRYIGPPSNVLNFRTPEGKPGTILSLDAFPIGSSALWLKWTPPAEANGQLTGYKIYYQAVNGTEVGPLLEREPRVMDPEATTAKLPALAPNTMYRVHVRATTKMGEGEDFYIQERTRHSQLPDVPDFTWETFPKKNGYSNIKVTWVPNLNGYPGSHFYAKYKRKGETTSMDHTDPAYLSNDLEIRGLQSGEVYVVSIVAVDGNHLTESLSQEIETSNEGPIIQPKENVATAGWFIGMMLAIAFLLIGLVIICMVKRNRGGKYAVHERELAAGRGDYPDEGGFHEYSQPLDTKSTAGRASLASSSHQDGKHPESDTDSMAEYGEGDTEGMNEDGSFIGQYGRQKKQEPNSQAFATLV